MATLFKLPKAVAVQSSGIPYALAKAYFYDTTTTTPKNVYTDAALSVAHSVPVQADAAGVFPPIYLDPTLVYKLTLKTSADVLIYTVDPVSDGALSQAQIGLTLYPRTAAEIAAGVTPVQYFYQEGYVLRYGENTQPGTTDMTTPIQNANNVMAQYTNGVAVFPGQRLKTTAEIARTLGVSFQGQGRNSTIIEAAHNGKIISCISSAAAPAIDDDQFAFVDGIGFKKSGASVPTHAIFYHNIAFTRVSNCRYAAGILVGEELQYVCDSEFSKINNTADTGTKIISSTTADGSNINKFTLYAWSGNATCGTSIDAHGSYHNEFDDCQWFSQPVCAIDHIYSAGTQFNNPSFEANVVNCVKLRGGDGIHFKFADQIDTVNLIDVASFGARNVTVEDCLAWQQSVQPPWPVNDEITVKNPKYTLNEAAGLGVTDEAHYFTEGHSTEGRQFSNHPSYATSSAFYADSHITPLGGAIPTASYNRIGSWDFTNGAQWTSVGTGGATDPYGGATAYNVNSIASTQNGGNGLGAAATGRTFTFQVWAKFVGRVRLGIGTTNLGIVKRANFYSTKATWRLLSVTYTSATDAGTTPLCNILTSQNTVMWRPCHYEWDGPLPALQPNRNLASVVGPIEVEDTRIRVYGTAAPAAGAFSVGDTTEQTVPVAGNPKRWRCTVAGTSGTWVSEGNL